MIKELVTDEAILSQPCEPATAEDAAVAQDLLDTLASLDEAACLAANQIGVAKAVVVYHDEDEQPHVMYNPVLKQALGAYKTVEGCLTLEAESKVTRYERVKVVYDDAQIERFKPLIEDEMRKMVETWGRREGNVYDDTVVAYGRAVLKWAGVPGSDVDLDPWAKRLGQIVEGFGHMPVGHTLAWVNRARCDKWAAGLIEKQRSGQINAPEGSALCEWARYRGTDGKLLDAKLAGIELQNSTRPAIAVSRFAAFAARFLVLYPQYREDIAREVETSGTLVDNEHAIAFAQEVRRLSPFVPMLPAFAREDFEWEGHQIKEGQRVIIDILGTNTDPNEWEEPLRFKPERFLGVEDAEAIKAFIPQGGGDVATGHRCPGEKVAVTELAATVSALCQPGINIDPGDLDYDPTLMPTRPRSGGRVQKD
ncbi:MAG: cytochrome P450 [Cutibacterium avidum]|nr:cytochrome P450 [Cutibacterium avidum]